MSRGPALSRRAALRGLGGAAALAGVGPAAAAPPGDTTRVTVGYETPAAGRAVRERADEVLYRFAFDAATVRLEAAAVESLRRREDVRYVEPDGVYEVAAQETPWGIDRVDADVVHGRGEDGEGVDVAVVDTGIDGSHGDLAANLGEGAAFSGGARHGNWQDDNGHGTHVAGVVGAIDDDGGVVGVAPAVTLHAVKVMASPGFGLTSDVAKGIEWAAEQGYDVVNLSVQGEHLQAVADACEYAAEQGATLVAAAGNEGECTDCVTYPAAYPEVIAVSSTDRDDDLAGHSSRGPEVDIAAPGKGIYSTYLGGYATLSGTSMACPHVAGAAAHLAGEGRSRTEIREALTDAAEDVGLSEEEAGAGRLDVAAALSDDSGGEAAASGSGDPEPESTPDAETGSGAEADAETPTPTPEATETASDPATATETPAPAESSPEATPTPEASARTATPTQTPTATGTSTATETPTPASTETSTPRATERPPAASGTPTPPDGGFGGLGAALDAVRDALRSLFG